MGLAIPLSLHLVCTLVSDAQSRGLSAPILSQAGHTPMCPVLQGAGPALQTADVGYGVSLKAHAGRKGDASSTQSYTTEAQFPIMKGNPF